MGILCSKNYAEEPNVGQGNRKEKLKIAPEPSGASSATELIDISHTGDSGTSLNAPSDASNDITLAFDEIPYSSEPSPTPISSAAFPKPFFPELRALILDHMDRQDVFNYSLCCKEFNVESMRIVWSHLDIPGPLYRSSRGVFEDACNTLIRVPERGKYVKSVAFLSRVGITIAPRPIDMVLGKDANIKHLVEQAMDLMPNVHSFAILRTVAAPRVDPVQMANRDTITMLFLSKVQEWLGKIPLRCFRLDYIPLTDVFHILQYCPPNLSHLSVRLTPQDLVTLESSTITPWSPANLTRLSTLEVDIQSIALFVSPCRPITDVSIHSTTSYPVLTNIGDTLREANTVRTLQFTNLPTATVAHILSVISPVPSLKTIVEKDKRWSNEAPRCENWISVLVGGIKHVPSLECYVVWTERVTAEDTSASSKNAYDLARHLNVYASFFELPNLRRIVIVLDRGSSLVYGADALSYQRDGDGKWQFTRCVGWTSQSLKT